MSTTAVLLDRAKGGDEACRNALAERCMPRVRRMALGRSARGAPFDPEDAVQETMLRAFSHLDGFVPRTEGAFTLYLRRILLNVMVDFARKGKRVPSPTPFDEGREPAGRLASPVEEAVGREAWDRYSAAVAELSETQAEAVVLFVECGLGWPEIAEAIESPSADAARMVVARGLKRLSELMRMKS
jgi:RNA polymerase sigma-70 factor (ECF subfamily)